MAGQHLEWLFSAAIDGALTTDERRRLDEHLAVCPACASALAAQRGAVEAVRALPRPAMPVAVVLPTSPPVAEAPRGWRWLAWAAPLLRPGPASATLVGAAGVAAAVLLVVHAHSGGSQVATSARGGGGGASVAAAAPPPGFGYSVVKSDPSRPGQQLVLAVSSSGYSAGQQVLVYARVTGQSQGKSQGRLAAPQAGAPAAPGAASTAGQLPVVTLTQVTPGATGSAGKGAQAGSAGSPAPDAAGAAAPPYAALAPAAPVQVASPTFDVVAGDGPLQVITIPGGLPAGTVLQLTAQFPPQPGLSVSGSPVSVSLTITVF